MSKIIARTFFSLSRLFRAAGKKVQPRDPRWAAILREWKEKRGDQTLRMEYDLDADSTVFDLGGFKGQWASDIYARYRCKIEIFEPYLPFATGIEQRFAKNPDVRVHRFGLDAEDKKMSISPAGDATSLFTNEEKSGGEEVNLKRAKGFLQANNFDRIDLMKINIEGGEYSLLEHLIEENLTQNIDNIQVQFHHFMPNAKARMQAIQEGLRKTHELTYQYEFLWENWRKR